MTIQDGEEYAIYRQGFLRWRKYLFPDAAARDGCRRRQERLTLLILGPFFLAPLVLEFFGVDLYPGPGTWIWIGAGLVYARIADRLFLAPVLEKAHIGVRPATWSEWLHDFARREGWGTLYAGIFVGVFLAICSAAMLAVGQELFLALLGAIAGLVATISFGAAARVKHLMETGSSEPAGPERPSPRQ